MGPLLELVAEIVQLKLDNRVGVNFNEAGTTTRSRKRSAMFVLFGVDVQLQKETAE